VCAFLFEFHSIYGSILHQFRYKVLENCDFFIPPCIRRPRSGGSRRNIAIPFGTEKSRMVGLSDGEKNFEDMCNRLDTIPACDGQTSCHGIVRAMHTRRAVIELWLQWRTNR